MTTAATPDWTFYDQLDTTSTQAEEERTKIAALFAKPKQEEDTTDYQAAFKAEKQVPHNETAEQPHSTPLDVTSAYQAHLKSLIATEEDSLADYQKELDKLTQLVSDKRTKVKKLQAIYVAIEELD